MFAGRLAPPAVDVLALHEALAELERAAPRKTRSVSLHFFAGLALPEIAGVLDVSLATVERDWRFARAWLRRAIGE